MNEQAIGTGVTPADATSPGVARAHWHDGIMWAAIRCDEIGSLGQRAAPPVGGRRCGTGVGSDGRRRARRATAPELARHDISRSPTFENVCKALKLRKIKILGMSTGTRIGFPFCWKISAFRSAPHKGGAIRLVIHAPDRWHVCRRCATPIIESCPRFKRDPYADGPDDMFWLNPVKTTIAPSAQPISIVIRPLIAPQSERGRLRDSAGMRLPASLVARGQADQN
jgi:hypothetical protein